MADVLQLIASVEWIALGVLVLFRLRALNKRLSDVLHEIEEEIHNA